MCIIEIRARVRNCAYGISIFPSRSVLRTPPSPPPPRPRVTGARRDDPDLSNYHPCLHHNGDAYVCVCVCGMRTVVGVYPPIEDVVARNNCERFVPGVPEIRLGTPGVLDPRECGAPRSYLGPTLKRKRFPLRRSAPRDRPHKARD